MLCAHFGSDLCRAVAVHSAGAGHCIVRFIFPSRSLCLFFFSVLSATTVSSIHTSTYLSPSHSALLKAFWWDPKYNSSDDDDATEDDSGSAPARGGATYAEETIFGSKAHLAMPEGLPADIQPMYRMPSVPQLPHYSGPELKGVPHTGDTDAVGEIVWRAGVNATAARCTRDGVTAWAHTTT